MIHDTYDVIVVGAGTRAMKPLLLLQTSEYLPCSSP